MKYYAALLSFLFVVTLSAQPIPNYKRASIEGAFGAHIPFNPIGAGESADYTGFERFDLGYRHMFHKNWGAKLQYSYDAFGNGDDNSGIVYNRVSLSMVYNAGRLFFPIDLSKRVGVLTHLGFGYAKANPQGPGGDENTATLNLGITPQLRLADRLALYLDVVYVTNFRQHYDFTGSLLSENRDGDTGSFATISVGIMFYLGNRNIHADWY